jgi:outer membrane protein insertion porin family
VAIGLLSLVLVFGLAGSVDVAKAAANPVVKAISVEGAKNIPPDVVMPVIKATKIGEEVTEDAVKKDLESIMALGYFFDLKARFVPQDGGVKVVFEVVENPKVKDITFIGDTSIPESVLKEAVGLETGQILNSNKLNEGLRRMLDKAANEYGVPLRVSDIAFADDGVVKVNLTATRLGDIKIDGNQKTKDWVIRREMSLRSSASSAWMETLVASEMSRREIPRPSRARRRKAPKSLAGSSFAAWPATPPS